ncbi:MAG TPA: M3 family oligoendopeptidase [Planctomycetota bacterium]|nr:M3 family oligoendopeptidase [Planctomycetota bacterium]
MDITYDPDVATPPRRYVPDAFDAADPDALERLGTELIGRQVGNPAAFEAWVLDWSDLARAFRAARQRRRIAVTRDTLDTAARDAHLAFEKGIVPRWRHLEDAFRRRYLESPFRKGLSPRFEMLDRSLASAQALFREANVRLLSDEEEVALRYSRLAGKRTVTLRGKPMREQECAALLEDPDRALRRDAYLALADARAADAEETEAIFDELTTLRHRIATNAGCKDYREFRFRDLQRFDYGPLECSQFHEAVERHVVGPLTARMEARKKALRLDTLRPWDRFARPDGRTSPPAFADEPGLVDLGKGIFRAVDPGFDAQFDILVRNGLLDLMARSGKAPGGYNAELHDIRLPFIFANSVGRYADVKTLLHEGGHAFHTLATRDEPVPELSHAPTEFCEVASMTMELFGLEHFDETLPGSEARAVAIQMLENRLWLFAWVATIDAFQHWIYTHPGHTRGERRETWRGLRRRFEPFLDWSGLEEAQAIDWHQQLHLFRYPFYYIEYGIAALGSLQVWQRFRRDRGAAIAGYRAALALGGSRPLPELFAAAGARFAMDGPAIADAVKGIVERLAEIE